MTMSATPNRPVSQSRPSSQPVSDFRRYSTRRSAWGRKPATQSSPAWKMPGWTRLSTRGSTEFSAAKTQDVVRAASGASRGARAGARPAMCSRIAPDSNSSTRSSR